MVVIQISLPLRLEIRTRRALAPFSPSTSFFAMRVGLPSESHTITLETWIAASVVMIPPDCAPRWFCVTRVCFLIRLTPSTSTRSRSG